jgi:hypothetical protein
MQWLYFILVAVHMLAVVVSGTLWAIIDINKESSLRAHYRDIQAVHFGSLYLIPTFLGLAYAFDWLRVPAWHWLFFPGGLFLLVAFSSLGYMFPRPAGVNPFYYWTRGPAMVLAVIGMACVVIGVLWTAAVLVIYSIPKIAW